MLTIHTIANSVLLFFKQNIKTGTLTTDTTTSLLINICTYTVQHTTTSSNQVLLNIY